MGYIFTANQNFGNLKVMREYRTNYSSISDMDYDIVEKFNSKVSKYDIVFHLGNFADPSLTSHEARSRYVTRLRGTHLFYTDLKDIWYHNKLGHTLTVNNLDGIKCVICHYRLGEWLDTHIHLYGINKCSTKAKAMTVSVDFNGMYPWTLEEIVRCMNK